MSIVVGIDPDSQKHGIAVYKDGQLSSLLMMTLPEIVDGINGVIFQHAKIAIEDVNINKFVYGRNTHASKAAQSKIAMGVGKCQQAQIELVRMLDHYGIKYTLIKPSKGNWAKNKALFEKVTGWTSSSNEDTRSAAWLGWQILK